MKRLSLIQRVRSLTRDLSNSIFREQDIIDWINEGIERFQQAIPELSSIQPLYTQDAEPTLIPSSYQHLLAIYASARCFSQDERHYQATTFMNEFEVKLEELKTAIENGQIIIRDVDDNIVDSSIPIDYVDLTPYWNESTELIDIDEGVEGVI